MWGRGGVAPALSCSIWARLPALARTVRILARAFTALAATCSGFAWGLTALVALAALSAGLGSRGTLGEESRG